MLLGGIDKETFGNTYDIPQTGAVTGKELADILAEYLSNAAEGGGANIQVQRAKAALAARKRELTQEVKTIHERKNEDIRQLIVEKDLLERDSRGLHANIADAGREIDQLKRVRVEEIGEKRKRLSEQERHQTVRMERQDAAPERTGAEKAGKSEWEKNSLTAWRGSDFVLLRCLSIQRYTTSLRIRHACFLFCRQSFLQG